MRAWLRYMSLDTLQCNWMICSHIHKYVTLLRLLYLLFLLLLSVLVANIAVGISQIVLCSVSGKMFTRLHCVAAATGTDGTARPVRQTQRQEAERSSPSVWWRGSASCFPAGARVLRRDWQSGYTATLHGVLALLSAALQVEERRN